MKKFIRRLFTLLPTEKLLVFLLSKFPHNRLLKGITPPNQYYPAKSIRRCRRQGINYLLDIHDYQNWLIYFYSDNDSFFWRNGIFEERGYCAGYWWQHWPNCPDDGEESW